MEKYNRKNAEMKKYDLALKNRIYNNTSSRIRKNKKTNEKNNEKKSADNYDPMDSQNIKLRISESFVIEDSDEEFNSPRLLNNNKPEISRKNEVIVISDSSEDEGSLNLYDKPKIRGFQSCLKPKNNKNTRNSSTGLESIDLSDEDSDIFTGSMERKQSIELKEKEIIKLNLSRTSEETNFDFGVDETRESVVDSSLKNEKNEGKLQRTPVINKNLMENSEKTVSKKFTPGSTKLREITTPISRKDAKHIMKLIKSKRIESPIVPRKLQDSSEEEIVTDEEQQQPQHPAWIDESDSPEEISLPKPSKTHVSRFLNPSIEPTDELTEEKKRQISTWLLNNPVTPRSEDSISVVSPSTKNASTSSGNSSLERFEMNYETPNNRDKFRDFREIRSTITSRTETPRQTVMDEYMKKSRSRPKTNKFETPPLQKPEKPLLKSSETPKAVLGECADLLDKLYGKTWRKPANTPNTEPRRAPILQDRGVQTEKIKKPKKAGITREFKKFVKDINPALNSTKKGTLGNYRDSFINDSSDSGDGDTTYATALTHPRISGPQEPEVEQKLRKKSEKTPISANTLKAIEICDSDSDEGEERGGGRGGNRRRLDFSDDEEGEGEGRRSSTSEYDPEDFLPPKSILPKNTNKINKINKVGDFRSGLIPNKFKGFLASLSGSVAMDQCHPDAKQYRINFKNNKEELVKVLYKLYNEKIFDNQLPRDMLIEWNIRMRGTAGFCYNKRVRSITGVTRTSRMALATKILDRPDRLRDTLVHEMCHAAAWIINDVSDGHGPFWKAWASKAMRVFPELPPIKRCHDYEISTKFTYRCVQCGYSIGRHSKSLDIEKKRCGHCFGKFELLLNRVTKSGTKLQIPRTPKAREPTAFALFVKENYSTLKKERRGMAHKEVMQLLGQQFSAIKLSKKNDNERNSSENSN